MLEATGVVVPMPLSKTRLSTLPPVHESVADCPRSIVAGLAESVQAGTGVGGGVVVVETSVEQVVAPPAPTAVMVKVAA